jgi:hypothetical protein
MFYSLSKVKTRSHFDNNFHSFLSFKSPEIISETNSSVWKFFKKANCDGSIFQICMRTAKNKGCNMSNLAVHLQRNHPMQYATINPQASKETDETVGFASSSQPTLLQSRAHYIKLRRLKAATSGIKPLQMPSPSSFVKIMWPSTMWADQVFT